VIASWISTGREGQLEAGDVDERIMDGEGDRSSIGTGEEDLYTYVRSFVGKNRLVTD
jgi:hypothetical protein